MGRCEAYSAWRAAAHAQTARRRTFTRAPARVVANDKSAAPRLLGGRLVGSLAMLDNVPPKAAKAWQQRPCFNSRKAEGRPWGARLPRSAVAIAAHEAALARGQSGAGALVCRRCLKPTSRPLDRPAHSPFGHSRFVGSSEKSADSLEQPSRGALALVVCTRSRATGAAANKSPCAAPGEASRAPIAGPGVRS